MDEQAKFTTDVTNPSAVPITEVCVNGYYHLLS